MLSILAVSLIRFLHNLAKFQLLLTNFKLAIFLIIDYVKYLFFFTNPYSQQPFLGYRKFFEIFQQRDFT